MSKRHPMHLLQYLRAEKGVGLRAMSERLGVTAATVSSWDAGYERLPTSAYLDIIELLQLTAPEAVLLGRAAQAPLRDREADRREAVQAIREGRAFASYAHQEGNPTCPCNSCRFERDDYGPVPEEQEDKT